METLNTIIENRDVIFQAAGAAVIAASLIVSGTKTPDPNTRIGKLYRVVEWLALTFGKAKDKGAVAGPWSK